MNFNDTELFWLAAMVGARVSAANPPPDEDREMVIEIYRKLVKENYLRRLALKGSGHGQAS